METIAELEQLGYDTLLPKHDDHDEHDVDKDHETKTERSFKSGHDEKICHSKQVRPHGTVNYGDQYVWTDLKTQSTIFCRKQMRPHGAVIYGNNPWHGECQPTVISGRKTQVRPHGTVSYWQKYVWAALRMQSLKIRTCFTSTHPKSALRVRDSTQNTLCYDDSTTLKPMMQSTERCSPILGHGKCYLKKQVRPHGTVLYWKKYVWATLRMQSLKIRKCFTSTRTKSTFRVRDSTKNTLCNEAHSGFSTCLRGCLAQR